MIAFKGITKGQIVRSIIRSVFAVRWILLIPYIGIVAALALYTAHFAHEVIEMFYHMGENASKQDILMLFLLELIDMTMISQLAVMTVQGGFAIFIYPLVGDDLGILPQWIKHGLNTSEQKIKLGMSIMGIMIVQLLKNFIAIHGGAAAAVLGDAALTQPQLWMREQMLLSVSGVTLMFCIFNILMHPQMLFQRGGHGESETHDNHDTKVIPHA